VDPTYASADTLRVQRRKLWGLAYRLTGSAADADDIVQETFARWLERSRDAEPSPSWFVRVVTNLGIDVLRLRRQRGYPGPWLPAPVGHGEEEVLDAYASADLGPEGRYGLAESATWAFLIALEALGVRQRAVLLLLDVFGYTTSETARALGTTEGNIRVLHSRARRALEAYDRARCLPTQALRVRHRTVLDALLRSLVAQDARALEDLLSECVQTVTDAGGEYTALRTPLVGRSRVARFYLQATRNRMAGDPTVDLRLLNGLPAAVITLARPVRRQAPCTVMAMALGSDGRIETIRTVMAPRKLVALHPDALLGCGL